MINLICILLINLTSAEESGLRGSISSAVNSDLKRFGDVDKDLSLSNAVRLSYLFPELFVISSGFFYDKDLTGMRKGQVRDSYFSLNKKLGGITDNLPLSGKVTIFLPISQSSRESSFLNTGYKLTGIMGVKLPKLPDLSLSLSLNFTQNFHNSQVSISGQSNKQFLASTGGQVSYAFLDNWDASLTIDYVKGFTYGGNIIDTYATTEEISFSPSEKTNIGLGHSLGGNIFKVNGYESNISLFDLNQSTVYLVFTMDIF